MAHYDCTCCGEEGGISHNSCPECQKGNCTRTIPILPPPVLPTELELAQAEADRQPSCSKCAYWWKDRQPPKHREHNDASGDSRAIIRRYESFCRRYPQYTVRHADDWCGEYKDRNHGE